MSTDQQSSNLNHNGAQGGRRLRRVTPEQAEAQRKINEQKAKEFAEFNDDPVDDRLAADKSHSEILWGKIANNPDIQAGKISQEAYERLVREAAESENPRSQLDEFPDGPPRNKASGRTNDGPT